MNPVDPSPMLFYFYFFIRAELVRVDPSWSDPDWRSELIRSDFCTCLFQNTDFSLLKCQVKQKKIDTECHKFKPTKASANKVNLSSFELKNFYKFVLVW